MAEGLLTPLQLTGGAGLLQNTGIALNSVFSGAVQEYESIAPIATLLSTLSFASAANLSNATILSLQSMGSSTCPSLADSIPNTSAGIAPFSATGANLGFLGFLESVGNTQLGNGDVGKFAQAFAASQGYVSLVNQFIISAANANEYLGPTFTNLDDMITADFTKASLALPSLGADIAQLGFLISLANIEHIGEPAALLQQLANIGKSTLPCVEAALRAAGLDTQNINDLVSNNRQSLFNPNGLTSNQFDRLQQQAYQGMTMIGGACLTEVLAVLEVITPNIADMADLLDPTKILPTSYPTLKFNGQLVYGPGGSVNSGISAVLNASTVTGCDELGKIIPPAQAVANKALQYQLQQVNGITSLTLPGLAAILV